MSKRIYIDTFKAEFRTLGYFADELFSAESDKELFRHIADYIVPLIRKSPHFDVFYFRWLKEKDLALKDYAYLKATLALKIEQAHVEIERTFIALKSDLESSIFLENPDIRPRIDGIAIIFKTKRETKLPNDISCYIHYAEEKIRELLFKLLSLGAENIVTKYGIIKKINADVMGDNTGDYKWPQKCISYFFFEPLITELREVENTFSSKLTIHSPWIAWEYLSLVEWCWNTPISFFGDNALNFQDYKLGNTKQDLGWLHDDWAEINAIKAGRGDQDVCFFVRSRFVACVKLVLNDMILYQGIEALRVDAFSHIESEALSPYSLEFKFLYSTKLFLEIVWFEHSNPVMFLVHNFQNGSKRHTFMRQLIDGPVNERILIPGECDNIAQYFEDMGLNNVVGDLFFERINTRTAARRCVALMGESISPDNRSELKKIINDNYREMPRRRL